MAAQTRAGKIASRIAKKYGIGKCDVCAKEISEALRNIGIEGEIIAISTGTKAGVGSRIMSKSRNEQISNQGYHAGVLVEGKVFDNVHTEGLPLGEWIQDFESRGDMVIESRKF